MIPDPVEVCLLRAAVRYVTNGILKHRLML